MKIVANYMCKYYWGDLVMEFRNEVEIALVYYSDGYSAQ
jgi:hypothetical protein